MSPILLAATDHARSAPQPEEEPEPTAALRFGGVGGHQLTGALQTTALTATPCRRNRQGMRMWDDSRKSHPSATAHSTTMMRCPGRLGVGGTALRDSRGYPGTGDSHGDFQPRNWLLHDGEVRLIDFGRTQWRPWTSDVVRLKHQQFVVHPELEAALKAGLDRELDSADEAALRLEEIQQAVSTVAWAHGLGDPVFEEHGRRMISRS